jgi:chromosome segregation protein
VHLKSLTMRGFKSFASATTLRFEPGITAVVGPNGSGKSNVVDAIAWVLGEQGAKALRGGKMEDVIFAGTSGRAPLGRAEVTLTIDNADGALPIDYTEVSVTRRMFRDGASEYEINGDSARLLDIQELLSDSGIGREMHVIVGQGQLDNVLQARPEDRRGFIEEAAGVLKHRKRKEKALRKLDGLQANLTRLTDLTTELRRQLKPLGRQADLARRAAGVQAELRDSRLRLLADDLLTLRSKLAEEVADETAVRARRVEVEARLEVATRSETEVEARLSESAPAMAAATQVHFALAGLQERFRSTEQITADRIRHLSQPVNADRGGRDPDQLDSEAAAVDAEEAGLVEQVAGAQAVLTDALAQRQQTESALTAAEQQLLAAARAVADRREGLATLTGRVNALRTRSTAAADEISRISVAAEQARVRAATASEELDSAQLQAGGIDSDAEGLDERYEAALELEQLLVAERDELLERRRAREQDLAALTARRDALALGLAARDAASAVLAAPELTGVRGSVADLLSVQAGYETAITAVLAAAADAIVVDSGESAAGILSYLKSADAGRIGLLVETDDPSAPKSRAPAITLTDGQRFAVEVVTVPQRLRAAVDRALSDVVLVPDLAAATRLVAEHPQLRFVTVDGDVVGRTWASGGSAMAPSNLQLRAELDRAQERIDVETAAAEQLSAALAVLAARHAVATADVESSLGVLNQSDAQFNALAERLAELAQVARSATAEADRLDGARRAAEDARDADLTGLSEWEERLRLAQAEPATEEPSTTERDELLEAAARCRQAEMDARLALRTREEQARALAGRAARLRSAAQAERAARAAREIERQRRARGLAVTNAVSGAARDVLALLDRLVGSAASARDELEAARRSDTDTLSQTRTAARELAAELASLTDAVHRDEVARAEQRLRIEQAEGRAAEEFGLAAEALLAEYGPDQPVPASNRERAEFEQVRERGETVTAPVAGLFDRPILEKRALQAERDLAQLGKVNPLALEEFAALEERHQFLATQLEDLKNTRRDLLSVVKDVDDRILAVFTAAFADVAAEFEIVFASLFPGGEGRLVLTEPDDMLVTGIEIEARPPGKKVKRLSLLSGGERSLTAVALLVAIFRARPSPFYVMDEIEAALDDVNLGRLIGLIGELRSSSQLIIITHQKRTMEVADALYGVTMRGDGISQVISQRLRTDESVESSAAGSPSR